MLFLNYNYVRLFRGLNQHMVKIRNNNDFKTNYIIIYNIFLIIFLLSSFIFFNFWTHSLFKNNNWNSNKTSIDKGLMGSWSFVLSYRALADNHLDIGTWHGYQEVFLKKPVDVENLSFDFKLSKNSYFTFFYSENHDTLEGIRISNDPKFPVTLLQVYNWEFLEKKPLKKEFLTDEWSHLTFKLNDDKAVISINDTLLIQIDGKSNSGNIVGFRGCENSTLIDNITIKEKNTSIEFYDDFGKKYSHGFYFLVLYLIFNIFFLLFYKRKFLFVAGMINLAVIFIFLVLFFSFYYQYRYPKEWMIDWHNLISKIEDQLNVNKKVEIEHLSSINKNTFKIMFLGTSQTWGAGATTEESTFVKSFERLIKSECKTAGVQCINTGIPAITSNELIKYYKENWIKIHPDLLIINLSLNDATNSLFKRNIEEIITLNKQKNIKTIVVLEPLAIYNQGHSLNHEILRDLAKQHHLPVIEMHNYLLSHIDDGFVYWDLVHLTDFGQKLFADKLFDEIGKEICGSVNSSLDSF